VSRFYIKYGIFDISHPYRPPRPVTEIALLYKFVFFMGVFLYGTILHVSKDTIVELVWRPGHGLENL
jgi:hypothetical protein